MLVDVGAGMGYFSLAAAARGHSVIAFELATRSLVSFAASMQHSNLSHAITLHQVCCGSRAWWCWVCLSRNHLCSDACSLAPEECSNDSLALMSCAGGSRLQGRGDLHCA